MKHHCHALGCKTGCPPKWLMCRHHWSMVSPDIQALVYATVGIRGDYVDETWAPWWRARAKAIAEVAFKECPDQERRDWYLNKEMTFADSLETRARAKAGR